MFKNLFKVKCQTSIMIILERFNLLNGTKKVENKLNCFINKKINFKLQFFHSKKHLQNYFFLERFLKKR